MDETTPIMGYNDTAAPTAATGSRIGSEQLKRFRDVFQRYKAAHAKRDRRITSSEEWWRLHNSSEETSESSTIGKAEGFAAQTGWLHNVIEAKHADYIDAYPSPAFLPREPQDRAEASILSDIVPVILAENGFEAVYDSCGWQKMKQGTAVYKVVWDASKLHGLGDVSISRVNMLNLYWQPGVTDIQDSRYVFDVELWDRDELSEEYPELRDKLKGNDIIVNQYGKEESDSGETLCAVIDVYYRRKNAQGQKILHYCKFVEDTVLYATEDNPDTAERGLYDHGMYPYVFDALYPIEDSIAGYGFVDLCRNPQTVIDMLNTAFTRNAVINATPRFFVRQEGAVNETEFADLSKAFVHVNGQLAEDAVRQISTIPLQGSNLSYLESVIMSLRETSGNTETSAGTTSGGVTAASAIAALQEASGKGSRASTKASYRAFEQICNIVLELIRQFYDTTRFFRIVGENGKEEFIQYTNTHIVPQSQGDVFGIDMGMRLPTFDIEITAQKKSSYSTLAQNEMALQFYQLGFFDPQRADQALSCLKMMEFDGKDELELDISRNGTMFHIMSQYMQLSLALAAQFAPDMVQGISNDINTVLGVQQTAESPNAKAQAGDGQDSARQEDTRTANARERSAKASQPEG